MSNLGRNDPCPCGSGKKYKKCCLPKEREAQNRSHERDEAFETAFKWLADHHEEAVDQAVEVRFLEALGPDAFGVLEQLPYDVQNHVIENSREWLVAQGFMEVGGEDVPALGLFLDRAGDLLSETQRSWLEAAARTDLELYQKAEADAGGVALELAWTSPEDAEHYELPEADPNRFRGAGLFGARVVEWEGSPHLTPALYPIPTWSMDVLPEEEEPDPDNPLGLRQVDPQAIIEEWLRNLVDQHLGRDAAMDLFAQGEPEGWQHEEEVGVTDVFEVRDWEKLETLLAETEGIEGDREEGWTIFEPVIEERGFPDEIVVGLIPEPQSQKDTLLAVTNLVSKADAAHDWLLSRGGEAIRFVRRETEEI